MIPLRSTVSIIALIAASALAAPVVFGQSNAYALPERLLRQGVAQVNLRALYAVHLTDQVVHPLAERLIPKTHHMLVRTELPDVMLHDAQHRHINLRALRGKSTLLVFGAVQCVYGCPDVLSQFVAIKRQLGPLATDVRFVMIGMDCHHDTPEALQAHVSRYDPSFLALTADVATVTRLATHYGWTALPRSIGQRISPYGIFSIYLDPDGNWSMAFPLDMPPAHIADEIAIALSV